MEGVHVEQDNVEDVMVNPRIHVDVLSISALRIAEIGAFQSTTEIREIILEVLPLGFPCRALHSALIRIDVTNGSCRPYESVLTWIRPVDFPQIPSGDRWWFGVVLVQPVDVHAVRADFDFLHEDVDSVVIAGSGKVGEVDGAGLATVLFQQHLDETSAGRLPADL